MTDWLDQLRAAVQVVRPYPAGMVEIPCGPHGTIAGRAFFPGGCGLVDGWTGASRRPRVVVVGNDFGTFESDYVSAARTGEELMAGTWAGVLDVLGRAGVGARDCFFTNALMGAREAGKNTGASPGMRDRGFAARCAEFLREQVRIIGPVGVVMVGKGQRTVVAAAFPDLSKLPRCETWAEIDAAGVQCVPAVQNPAGGAFRFCALMHPSLRASNMSQRGRRFEVSVNDAAEVEMLRRTAIG